MPEAAVLTPPPIEIKPFTPPKVEAPKSMPEPSSSTPSTVETTVDTKESKEELKLARQKDEVTAIGELSIGEQMQAMNDRLKAAKTDAEREAIYNDSPKWMRLLHFGDRTSIKEPIKDHPSKPKEAVLGDLKLKDDEHGIAAITFVNKDVIQYDYIDASGGIGHGRTISHEDFKQRVLIGHADEIVASRPPQEQAAVRTYLDMLKDPSKPFAEKTPEQIDKLIVEGARSLGIPVTEDIKALITHAFKEPFDEIYKEYNQEKDALAKERKDLEKTPEGRAEIHQREAQLEERLPQLRERAEPIKREHDELITELKLDEINLADAGTFATVLDKLGLSKRVDRMQAGLARTLVDYHKALKETKDPTQKAEIKAKIEELEIQQKILAPRLEQAVQFNQTQKMGEMMWNGAIPLETRKAICEAIATGKTEKVFEELYKKVMDESDSKADKSKLHRDKFVKNIEKGSLIATLAVLLMAYAGVKAEGAGGGGGMH